MFTLHSLAPLIGGVLIGLAASLFLLAHGRVCGVSGIFSGLLTRGSDALSIRSAFIAGLVLGGLALRVWLPEVFASSWTPSWMLVIPAGLLVGAGTQLGSGCTSGHGICGVSRLSVRSIVATFTFISTGMVTVFVARHVLGGAP